MSTSTVPPLHLDISGTAKVPFARLVRVELRKMLDTRGGFWLLLVTGILLALTVVLVLIVIGVGDTPWAPSLTVWATQILLLPLSFLLPVFPILSVTSEWGQRTGLTTFVLEANRLKVLAAKLGAVLLLACGTVLLALVLAVIGTPVGAALGDSSPQWDLDWGILGGSLVAQLLFFLMAFALASVLLSTPAAISVFYVMGLIVPMVVYSVLLVVFEWAQDLIPYIDLTTASIPFTNGVWPAGQDWAHLGVATLLWIVVPVAVGARRIMRTEIK